MIKLSAGQTLSPTATPSLRWATPLLCQRVTVPHVSDTFLCMTPAGSERSHPNSLILNQVQLLPVSHCKCFSVGGGSGSTPHPGHCSYSLPKHNNDLQSQDIFCLGLYRKELSDSWMQGIFCRRWEAHSNQSDCWMWEYVIEEVAFKMGFKW